MKVELLTEQQGDTFSMHITGITKADLPVLEQRLQQPIKPGMYDRYGATESLNSILNGLIVLTTSEQMLEKRKANPDGARIAHLKGLFDEVWAVNKDSANFDDVSHMKSLIAKYGPILQAEKKKVQG